MTVWGLKGKTPPSAFYDIASCMSHQLCVLLFNLAPAVP